MQRSKLRGRQGAATGCRNTMRFMRPVSGLFGLTALSLVCIALLPGQSAPAGAAKPAAAKAMAKKPVAKSTSPAGTKSALDKTVIEAYVRHLLLWSSRIDVKVGDYKPAPMAGFQEVTLTASYQKVSLDETFYVSSDGRKIVRGSVYDVDKSPFTEQLKLLHTNLQPSMGAAGEKVSIVVFTDFECPFCKEEAKSLRANLLKSYPSGVRLYFQEFPLDAIHPWARLAAIAGRCVFHQSADKFWEYHDFAFDNQDMINTSLKDSLEQAQKSNTAPDLAPARTKILEWAAGAGIDTLALGSCIDRRETEPEVDRSAASARALKVNQTPSLFINGRPLAGNIPWEQMKAYIDWELEYSAKQVKAAEECCSITLPGPGK